MQKIAVLIRMISSVWFIVTSWNIIITELSTKGRHMHMHADCLTSWRNCEIKASPF